MGKEQTGRNQSQRKQVKGVLHEEIGVDRGSGNAGGNCECGVCEREIEESSAFTCHFPADKGFRDCQTEQEELKEDQKETSQFTVPAPIMPMIRYLVALSICAAAYSVCPAFEVTVLPSNPRGGEAVLVSIKGEPDDRYLVTFKGKEYTPFFQKTGAREIYLPLAIDDSGTEKIKIKRLAAETEEAKHVDIAIKERIKKVVQLQVSDEAMRDKEPMVEHQNQSVLETLRYRSDDRLWKKRFRMPLDSPISTSFATHRKGKTYNYYHKGLDFSAPAGTPVKAMNAGKVILSEKDLNVYGNMLVIDHGQGIISCYFHLSKLLKQAGETVQRGEIIGKVGSTGWATGPHLHMGVYVQGQAIDPVWWTNFTADLDEQATITASQSSSSGYRLTSK